MAEIASDQDSSFTPLSMSMPETGGTAAARDLCSRLLQPDPQQRLRSLLALRNVAFFKGFSFEDVMARKISLAERPISKDQLTIHKKIARGLRPCILRRPMSATPSFGYRGTRNKKMPPWSRPQSAGGSSSLRRNKLAAKFSNSSLHDPDYCAEFGATYTMSSSQLLQSLMGSCSINEGLDSDITPTPSPQPSLGDTIRAAAQLEPGLTSKPPLPPTPQPRAEATPTDDIIALKFQRWFPDAILESEIIQRTALSVNPFERPKDETDQSDAGTSITDGAEMSDREGNEKQSSTNNISTFVKKRRTPQIGDEDSKKSGVKFNDSKHESSDENIQDKKSPLIVVHEPDPYGCDVVTEEFTSEKSIRCLTPDYIATLKKSSRFAKGKTDKHLSLSDLNDATSPLHYDIKSHSAKVYSESEMYKDDKHNLKPALSTKSHKGFSDSELVNCKDDECNISSRLSNSGNEIESPANFETSAPDCRLTSSPITHESNQHSPDNILQENDRPSSKNNEVSDKDFSKKEYSKYSSEEFCYEQQQRNYHRLSPPVRLRSEEMELYHDHVDCKTFDKEKHTTGTDENRADLLENEQIYEIQDKNKTLNHERNPHSTNDVKPFSRSVTEIKKTLETVNDTNKNLTDWLRSYSPLERNLATVKEKGNNAYSPKISTKHGSMENVNKVISNKSNKAVKEIFRAASVPPYLSSKLPVPLSKPTQYKDGHSTMKNSKRKIRRSMSYDATKMDDISEKDSGVSSYEDIVTMIKVLEKEDLETPVMKYKASPPLDSLVPEQSSSAKAILNFLDEVERGTMVMVDSADKSLPVTADDNAVVIKEPMSSRLGSLLNTDTTKLAQQVMTSTLQLEEQAAVIKALEERYRQSVELIKQQKTEGDETNRRHQKFIDQLLKEKRQLAVQYESAIREMEAKNEAAIKVIEERHKVEMKKAQEKFNAAEKIRRDKWIDTKTKKIKELTVRGLEPELERMAVAHQEELAELRRVHQRQLTEAESAWVRRSTTLREQEASEHQGAILHEREAARQRMEQEMCQVEKSYQEQRRRLLEEVRQEKELLQRQTERVIAEKQAEMASQLDEAKQKLQTKLAGYDKQHEDEIAKLREGLQEEKQAWIIRQKGGLQEKEAVLREELKRERDRHIELVIRRLESEAASKEQAIENKIKRLKESYDGEVNDLDSTLKDLRARLKEARADLQKSEDKNSALSAQFSQSQNELQPLKQTIERLRKECNETVQQSESKVAELQREISEIKQSFQEQLNKTHNEKEKQLQEVYTRVKEAISRKEEALQLVTRQRDTALEQCDHLEKLLESQRHNSLKL